MLVAVMPALTTYAFYNNKGGVGKTTLCTNIACKYADEHPERRVLVVDMCPQSNASQFLLGGGRRGHQNNQTLQNYASRKNIVGFIDWLINGNLGQKPHTTYSLAVSGYNQYIPRNLFLIAGDSFLESLSLALSYAVLNPANTQAWPQTMTALRRLFQHEAQAAGTDTIVFIDCNPSFSIYTQMALASSDKVVIPMMADYSSAEGITSMFTMMHGVYPTAASQKYAQNIQTFSKQVIAHDLQLPVIWEIIFNNYTSNLGVANAYNSIRSALLEICWNHYQLHPALFAPVQAGTSVSSEQVFADIYMSDVKDFHSAGKVAAALGIPMFKLPGATTYTMPDDSEVGLPQRNYEVALGEIKALVAKIP